MARIVALFRRVEMLSGAHSADPWLQRGDLRLSHERMEVQWMGKAVPLTVTELWIVHFPRTPPRPRAFPDAIDG